MRASGSIVRTKSGFLGGNSPRAETRGGKDFFQRIKTMGWRLFSEVTNDRKKKNDETVTFFGIKK